MLLATVIVGLLPLHRELQTLSKTSELSHMHTPKEVERVPFPPLHSDVQL
jgi:hypothetical protein